MNAGDMDYQGATIHVMRGLPRAGKSTAAAKYMAAGGVIVSKDSIRLALHGKPFVDWLEPEVADICRYMVSSLLYSGHRVIILDECFPTAQSVKTVHRLWPMCTIKEHLIDTPPEVCIERAIKCGQEYLIPVIKELAAVAEWLKEGEPDC